MFSRKIHVHCNYNQRYNHIQQTFSLAMKLHSTQDSFSFSDRVPQDEQVDSKSPVPELSLSCWFGGVRRNFLINIFQLNPITRSKEF